MLAQALQQGPFGKRVRAAGTVGVMCVAEPVVRAGLPAFIAPTVQLLAGRVSGKQAGGPCHPYYATQHQPQQLAKWLYVTQQWITMAAEQAGC